MEILHQYYYRQGVAATKAVFYTILSVIFVIVYGMMTLAVILSAIESFRKTAKTRNDIPAFAVGADFFVFYGTDGSAIKVPFADCEQVRFKTTLQFRVPMLKLIVKYHDRKDPENTLRFEVVLGELDRPVNEIDKQLKSVYRKYKKASPDIEGISNNRLV